MQFPMKNYTFFPVFFFQAIGFSFNTYLPMHILFACMDSFLVHKKLNQQITGARIVPVFANI